MANIELLTEFWPIFAKIVSQLKSFCRFCFLLISFPTFLFLLHDSKLL